MEKFWYGCVSQCTVDDFKDPMEIQSFILQDKLQLLGMEQFCWILYTANLQC